LTVACFGPWEKEPPVAYPAVNRSRLGLWSRIKKAALLVLGIDQKWDEYTFEYFGQIDKLDKMVKKIKKNYREWEKLGRMGNQKIHLKIHLNFRLSL